MVVADER